MIKRDKKENSEKQKIVKFINDIQENIRGKKTSYRNTNRHTHIKTRMTTYKNTKL